MRKKEVPQVFSHSSQAVTPSLQTLKTSIQELTNDFNNLLAGIIGNVGLLEQEKLVAEGGLKPLQEIKLCAKRASLLTQKLSELILPDRDNDRAIDVSHPETRDARSAQAAKQRKVLVIDDEELVRSVSAGILSRAGFTVVLARDGREGLEIFEHQSDELSCIILDWSMPYMKGNLVFARLRAIDPSIPIFIMSGHSDEEIVRQFEQIGASGIIHKPFQPESLIEAVRNSQKKNRDSQSLVGNL